MTLVVYYSVKARFWESNFSKLPGEGPWTLIFLVGILYPPNPLECSWLTQPQITNNVAHVWKIVGHPYANAFSWYRDRLMTKFCFINSSLTLKGQQNIQNTLNLNLINNFLKQITNWIWRGDQTLIVFALYILSRPTTPRRWLDKFVSDSHVVSSDWGVKGYRTYVEVDLLTYFYLL